MEIDSPSLMAHLPQYVQLDEEPHGLLPPDGGALCAVRVPQVAGGCQAWPAAYLDISRASSPTQRSRASSRSWRPTTIACWPGGQAGEDVAFSPDVEKFLREMGERLEGSQEGEDDADDIEDDE